MIAFLSPAMNMEPVSDPPPRSRPFFEDRALALASQLRKYASWELERLLKTNEEIALRAYTYYQAFDRATESPALLSFRGLAYRHIAPADFTAADLDYAQKRLVILSALYGLLRPMDGIRSYRLDFMGRFRPEGKGLYSWWGADACRRALEPGETLVNLASAEYEKLILPHLGPGEVVTCRFLTPWRGKLVSKATDSKMARGEMARFIVKNRIDRPKDLTAFRWEGYAFVPRMSGESTLCYVREY